MDALTITALVLGGISLFAFLLMRRRAIDAEATVRTIGDVVGPDVESRSSSSELTKRVRAAVERDDQSSLRIRELEAVLHGAAIGIAVVSPSGAIEFANRTATSLIDSTGEWAVLATRVSALGKRAARDGVIDAIELDMHEPERRVLVLSAIPLFSEPLTPDGDPVVRATAVYIDDQTEARRVDAMRKDFVANASHELKTPLGALALLAETLGYADSDEKRNLLADRLRTEATRMARLVDDILTLARTESLPTTPTRVELADVVREVVDSVVDRATDSGIRLINGGVGAAATTADSKQLVSAVRNVFDNAITYTAAKGEPGQITYRCAVVDGAACIEVEDSGIGIPAGYTDRVFERFFRVDQARSRTSGGTGLGLSIVRNVARAHGGTVSIDSHLGIGTTVRICLPIVEKEPA
jgi:two-component system sensor histidine kinase SenX3